jgi:predicted XRE-type DNA-binding protein
MGRVGHVSSDPPSAPTGGRVRSARISKKDASHKPKGSRLGGGKVQATAKKQKLVEEPLVMERFDSVWEALGFGPEEAANLTARSSLMMQIEQIIEKAGWTQAEAARRCGVTQPRINDLLRGKINKFSVDALVNMAGALGRRIDFQLLAA